MKPFSSYLTELFDQPWLHIDTTVVRAFNGSWIHNYIYADPADPKNRQRDLVVVWEKTNSNSWELMFHRGGSFTASGQGGAGGVFASVLDAAEKFMKHTKPAFITFSASKSMGSSRERAYGALVKRFASRYGYTVDSAMSGGATALWKLRRNTEW